MAGRGLLLRRLLGRAAWPPEAEAGARRGLGGESAAAASPRLGLAYTCKVCGRRAAQTVSRAAYERGVVIATCPGCRSRHLIADHLGWFAHLGGHRDVEEILAARGEAVRRVAAGEALEIFAEEADAARATPDQPSGGGEALGPGKEGTE
ncbi:DNL-type zinc finger protein [Paroedura picta]|uniref:DNL-type zinc finger protein n=1 Tax=Paroedura picta TaxID=143630 RepID=UPI00101566D4